MTQHVVYLIGIVDGGKLVARVFSEEFPTLGAKLAFTIAKAAGTSFEEACRRLQDAVADREDLHGVEIDWPVQHRREIPFGCPQPFMFDGNQAWGLVTEQKLRRLRRIYGDELLGARMCLCGGLPSFGFRGEHRGDETLADWFCEQRPVEVVAFRWLLSTPELPHWSALWPELARNEGRFAPPPMRDQTRRIDWGRGLFAAWVFLARGLDRGTFSTDTAWVERWIAGIVQSSCAVMQLFGDLLQLADVRHSTIEQLVEEATAPLQKQRQR